MHTTSDICVIGNGVIGKIAALGLAQAGLSVTLLSPALSAARENSAQTDAWDARVYAVNHVAHHLLQAVRVWKALDAERIAPVESMIVNGDGDRSGTLTFDAYSARSVALAWIVEDRNINQALDAALKFAPNLRMVAATATQLHLVHGGQAMHVHLDNGDVIEASLVVGADGGQSWVRGQCDIGLDYRAYGQQAIVTNFACEKPHHGVAYQWFTENEGIVALLPLPGQRVSLVWSAPEGLAPSLLSLSASQLGARVSAVSAQQLGMLYPLVPEQVKAFPLSFIRPHAIVAPRVALVGDAAHVIHPLAGHGMNLGFADVAALLKVVTEREPYRDCGDERVLERYARARKEEILLMQLATDGLERLFSSPLEPVRTVRNWGLNLVNKLPVIKRGLINHAMGNRR